MAPPSSSGSKTSTKSSSNSNNSASTTTTTLTSTAQKSTPSATSSLLSSNGLVLPLHHGLYRPSPTTSSPPPFTSSSSSSKKKKNVNSSKKEHEKVADFIGPSDTVKHLFSLPYNGQDGGISVAIHKLSDGSLLLDGGDVIVRDENTTEKGGVGVGNEENDGTPQQRRKHSFKKRPRSFGDDDVNIQQYPTLPTGDVNPNNNALSDPKNQNALSFLSKMLQQQQQQQQSSSLKEDVKLLHSSSKENLKLLKEKEEEDELKSVVSIETGVGSSASTIDLFTNENNEKRENNALALTTTTNVATTQPTSSNSTTTTATSSSPIQESNEQQQQLNFPPPEYYTSSIIKPPPNPRQYVSWKVHDYKLLIASDAVIWNPAAATSASSQQHSETNKEKGGETSDMSQALTIRIENIESLKNQLTLHRQQQQQQQQRFDSLKNGSGYASYAEALTSSSSPVIAAEKPKKKEENIENEAEKKDDSESEEEKEEGKLQTCIIPTLPSTTTAPLTASGMFMDEQISPPSSASSPSDTSSNPSSSSSAICTVLDAYLDNIMANVPQLALCLQEKGFVQSVKVLKTQDIPSHMISDGTLNMTTETTANEKVPNPTTSSPNVGNDTEEPLFSPAIVEMNATMLLRFLKSNCTRDNTTYLLKRHPNSPEIRLYDISNLSSNTSSFRKRKWVWWLATMSHRFALRLNQLSHAAELNKNKRVKRLYRKRQRSLLSNALELLQDLEDMDGEGHELICGSIMEHLADTFLECDDDDDDVDDDDNDEDENGGDKDNEKEAKAQKKKTRQKNKKSTTATAKDTANSTTTAATPKPTSSSSQPYGKVTADGLSKAQDHLLNGIKKLWPLLEQALQQKEEKNDDNVTIQIEAISLQLYGLHYKLINVSLRLAERHLRTYWSSSAMQALRISARRIKDAVGLLPPLGVLSHENEEETAENEKAKLYLKSLKKQYAWLWECCGHFARSFAADDLWRERGHACGDDVVSLLRDVEVACSSSSSSGSYSDLGGGGGGGGGASSSSFSPPSSPKPNHKDENERKGKMDESFLRTTPPITLQSNDCVTLYSLSGLVIPDPPSPSSPASPSTKENQKLTPLEIAKEVLNHQKQLKRDERRVLVASSVCYSRAIGAFTTLLSDDDGNDNENNENNKEEEEKHTTATAKTTKVEESILSLLRQRLGDACNEIGKILLTEVKNILSSSISFSSSSYSSNNASALKQLSNADIAQASAPLLLSAEFWFNQGLKCFDSCHDLRNIALLRCNLCQCCKIRANANVALPKKGGGENGSGDNSTTSNNAAGHAEACLQEAADHLLLAHEALGTRDSGQNHKTWDMVSEELAATFLVLGVRRRQSLLGGGATPVIVQALRLTPGKERSVVEPMERAMEIYTSLGNSHQAAAAHYQLALFYSRVWTCQRDEGKTREKLSAAFRHYGAAQVYFSSTTAMHNGNEPTFVILSLDLSNLYSAVSNETECVAKALTCCLDTREAFSLDAINAAMERHRDKNGHSSIPWENGVDDWFDKMKTLATTIEDRVFKLLLNLVKIEKDESQQKSSFSSTSSEKYKDLYRLALSEKMSRKRNKDDEGPQDVTTSRSSDPPSFTFPVHSLLNALWEKNKK